jgi:pimeloyl-ACP methyl ester carboxylesterase
MRRSDALQASVEAWFAGGERFGYDPKAAAMVTSAALKVYLRSEGDLAHAVSFLPGYPDGSFGWAKVLPYLPNAAAMPKLFVEYVGMGDSDKPKDYAYSTAERPISLKPSGAVSPSSPRRWLPLTFPRSWSWSICDAGSSAPGGANPRAGH